MKKNYMKNTIKAIVIMLSAYLLLFFLVILFPSFGSLLSKGINISKIIRDSLLTILPALIVIVPFSFILGWISSKARHHRLVKLLLTGIIIYFLSIFIVMLLNSGISIIQDSFSMFILLVLWAFLAYFIFVIPLLIIGIFLLEKWTR